MIPSHWLRPHLRSFIAKSITSTSGSASPLTLLNPATNTEIAKYIPASDEEIEAAVNAASKAQREWAGWTGTQRGRILRKAAEILHSRTEMVAKLETLTTGRALAETLVVDIESARDALDFFGGLASLGNKGVYIPRIFKNGSSSFTQREPVGLGVGICGFNYPIQGAAWKAAPALACGNAIIIKPSETTPLSTLALAEALYDAGLPDGLFQVILGDGTIGQKLVTHPRVNKVSFTGSVGTGKRILSRASLSQKITMELGGKSPMIIFKDCDFEQALRGAIMGNFYSNGEVCSNGTRIFVQREIHDTFLKEFVSRTKQLLIGDPMDTKTEVGPLISKQHMEKVLGYIEHGKNIDKAKLLCGGNRVLDFPQEKKALKDGNFVSPTIFSDCTDDMKIMKEEIFGPVACVTAFDTEEEVLKRANDSPFGLGAGVFTKDIQRAHRFASELQAGVVWINNFNTSPVEVPWGGYKESGVGRENGESAINYWTQEKTVHIEAGEVWCPIPAPKSSL